MHVAWSPVLSTYTANSYTNALYLILIGCGHTRLAAMVDYSSWVIYWSYEECTPEESSTTIVPTWSIFAGSVTYTENARVVASQPLHHDQYMRQ